MISMLIILNLLSLSGCAQKTEEDEKFMQVYINEMSAYKDLGTIKKGSKEKEVGFLLYNPTDKPIKIIQAKASCTCLTGRIQDDTLTDKTINFVARDYQITVPPQDRKTLFVNFRPQYYKGGESINQFISFQTDYSENKLSTINFKGTFK